MKGLRRLMPFLFLVYGLFSVATLQRDFTHITRLGIFVLLVGPAFFLLSVMGGLLERLAVESKWIRYGSWIRLLNLSATQTMAQYILIFCLPFYVVRQDWIYFGVNLLWLGTLLWDPLYEKLVQGALYRHTLLAWTLISASSFLYPFVIPNHLEWFYPSLALVSLLGFIPTRKETHYILMLVGLWTLSLIPLLVLDPPSRFPLLSVWTKQAQFELDSSKKGSQGSNLGRSITQKEVQSLVSNGHAICCVAPVIAPPGFRFKVHQYWTLGDRLIESVELKTPIRGKSTRDAFHSYFCKQNFPFRADDERLRCRVHISEGIDIGGASIEVIH